MSLMLNIPVLNLFFIESNSICGYVYNHPDFEDGDQIMSNYLDRIETWIDHDGRSFRVAICAGNEKFKLANVATQSEIDDFRRGAEMPKVDLEKQRDGVSDIRRSIG
jgi:hypothetical protein